MTETVNATVELGASTRIVLEDDRDWVREIFQERSTKDQAELAGHAWTIGLRALRLANLQAEEAKLKDVGEGLVTKLDQLVRSQAKDQYERMAEILKRYFDGKDGQLPQALDRLLADDGDLMQQLRDFSHPETGELARSLAKQIGAESPLMQKLNPENRESILFKIESSLQKALEEAQQQTAKALDPLQENSPVKRFLDTLKDQIGKQSKDTEERILAVTKALNAEDENSMIRQLEKNSMQATEKLLFEINPAKEGSAMRTIRDELTGLLEKQYKEQQQHHRDVMERLTKLETTKKERAKSARGGNEFEDLVGAFLEQVVQGGGFLLEHTGSTTGLMPGRRTGDHVIGFGPDHAFHGARMVVESKRENLYTVPKALAQLEEARKNRKAQAGLFVLAASSREPGFPAFQRLGQNVLVVWDPEDPATDPYLEAGVLLALGLVPRVNVQESDADLDQISGVANQLEKELERLDDMDRFADNVIRDGGKIKDEIRKGKGKIRLQIDRVRDALRALEIQETEERLEQGSPIGLGDSTLGGAGGPSAGSDAEDSPEEDRSPNGWSFQ